MSLKAFHIFFILVCLALCLFLITWSVQHDSTAMGAFGGGGLLGLLVYFRWFLKKFQSMPGSLPLIALVSFSMTPHSAQACAVCFGLADHQTTSALQNSIIFMIGVTAVVLGLLTFFILKVVKLANEKNSH